MPQRKAPSVCPEQERKKEREKEREKELLHHSSTERSILPNDKTALGNDSSEQPWKVIIERSVVNGATMMSRSGCIDAATFRSYKLFTNRVIKFIALPHAITVTIVNN